MRYDKDGIIEAFNLSLNGSQGWLSNKSMPCPFCGKAGKWGIIFNPTGIATFHCWKCPRKTSLYEFLKKTNRLDLAKKVYTAKPNEIYKCPKIGGENAPNAVWETYNIYDDEEEQELKPIQLPLRLKPLVDDEYLNRRGFKEEHYKEFEPSYTATPLEEKLQNYIIFKMKIGDVCVAWWARSRYTKEWHKQNLEEYKQHKAKLILRYRNSESNFQDLLGGYNFLVKDRTKTVVLVEGIFDFINVWNLLDMKDFDEIKCCFTFGNNIGQGQIKSLIEKHVENVVLMYDYGTINESKEAALRMREYFKSVKVAAITKAGVDPGNITLDYLEEVLDGAVDPLNFFCNRIEIKL